MKNECSIVRDLLPLYAEGMLSEDSAAFVKEHLDTCKECRALSAGEEPSAPTDADTEQRTGEAGVLRTLMLRINSIDYLAAISSAEQYTFSDRMALLFKGDYSDQDKAEAVLSNAHIVFEYSEEEIYNNVLAMPRDEAAYAMGALVRYCVPEMDAGKMLTIYHIDLLSAHFSGDSGKMWVKYGYQRFDKTDDLSTCTGTGAIDHIVLWKLEKYGDGYWRVVEVV